MRHYRFLGPAALLAILGCSSNDTPPGDGLQPPPANKGIQLRLDVTLQPGQEVTVCKYFVVPDGGIDVAKFEHEYTDVSHHILLYPTFFRPEDVTAELLYDCDTDEDIRQYIIGIVYGSQSAAEVAAYPEGVGMKTFGGQVLMLEYHAINTTDAEVDASARVNMWKADYEITAEAGTLFYYHPTIALDPNTSATVRMRCQVPEGIRLLFGLGHMHRRGVKFRSWLKGGPQDIPLVSADSWYDADTRLYEPHIEVGPNQYIEFECQYFNPEPRTIIEGLSAEHNEMCVYLGSYYVQTGGRLDYDTEWCQTIDSGPIYTGDTSCAQTAVCVDAAGDDIEWERCWMNACEPVTRDSVRDYIDCARNACPTECAAGELGSGACAACSTSTCDSERSACSDSCAL